MLKLLLSVPIAFGLLIVLGATWWAVQIHRDDVAAQHVTGVVTALNAGEAHPEIDFTTRAGKHVSFPAGGLISHEVGDRVRVSYDPKDPLATAQLEESGSLYFLPTIFGTIGLGFMAPAVITSFATRKRRAA